jgi:hypothetical protein
MTVLTLFLSLPILILAHGGATADINEALNYVAGTLLFAGAALVPASALPRDPDQVGETPLVDGTFPCFTYRVNKRVPGLILPGGNIWQRRGHLHESPQQGTQQSFAALRKKIAPGRRSLLVRDGT